MRETLSKPILSKAALSGTAAGILAFMGSAVRAAEDAAGHAAEHAGEHGEGHHGLVHFDPWLYVVESWIAIAIILLLGVLAARNLRKIPGPLQNFMEMTIGGLESFFVGVLGPGGERHAPFLVALFLYILVMNLFGLTGILIPPTSTLNMTVALAVVAIIYVQWQGIRAHGLGGYLKHFWGEPWWLGPLMLPLHIIGELAKPLSLAFRLFGNIFGEETVIVQITLLGPLVVFGSKVIPIQFPLLIFGVLKSVIQALVFSVLTAAYLVIMVSHEDDHGHGHGDEDALVEGTEHEPAQTPASAAA